MTVVVLAGMSAPASAAALLMSLSSVYGPSGGGGTIVGTVVPTPALPAPFAGTVTPTVQFQTVGSSGTTSCSAMAMATTQIVGSGTTATAGVLTVDPGTVKPITSSRIVFGVPTGPYPVGSSVNPAGLVLVGTQTQAKWNVCIYDTASTTSSTLLAAAAYTIAVQPTITSITPASSPAAGRQTITVTGNGFAPVTTAITGSIGGAALSNIKVATNGKSFTAVTGVRAPGTGLALIVATPGGSVNSLDPDNDSSTTNPIPFTYSNGITISPSTAASGSVVTVDVTGAGFSALTFDTTGTSPTSAQAHVFLVPGAYAANGNRGVAECVVDTVVSDTELVCTMDLAGNGPDPTTGSVTGNPIGDDAYILTVVQNGSPGAGSAANPSIVSSGAAFIVGPY